MFYVYLLENQDDKSWYTGFSSNLKQRVKDHNNGKGSRYTKSKISWKLIYYEAYVEKSDALGRERFLKSGSGKRFLNKQLKNYLDI